jgi:hypothetical protein
MPKSQLKRELSLRLEFGFRFAGGAQQSLEGRSPGEAASATVTNSFEAVVLTATVRRHNSDYRDAEVIGHRT